MATKYQYMAALSEHTAKEITSNPVRWISFLNTASSVYKYPFSDQLMIYAQRPDTPACASMEIWNNKMNRWVNRGAKGIALIDDSGAKPQLKYVFDIRDTHLGRWGKTPYLWRLQEEHTEVIRDHLIEAYNLDADIQTLHEALREATRQNVLENLDTYFADFRTAVEGSFLEELDELNQLVRFRETLINSVQYMLLYRCGLEPENTMDVDDFSFITDFNTLAVISQIGYATSEIAKPMLMDIGREIRAYDRESQRRNSAHLDYNGVEDAAHAEADDKGGLPHETDLHPNGGLSDSEPDAQRGDTGDSRQVRDASQDLSEDASGWDVSSTAAERQIESAPAGDRPDGEQPDGADHGPVAAGQPGSGQGSRSDGLGAAYERSDTAGGGDRAAGAGVPFDSRVKCAIAHFNDIEMYYCNAPHIVKVCEAEGLPLAEQDAVTLIAESMHEAEEESKKKFYTHRVDKARQERKDARAAMLEAETAFAADETVFAYGKKVAGLLKAKLQQKFGKNIDIYKPTEQISDSQFVDIHSAA